MSRDRGPQTRPPPAYPRSLANIKRGTLKIECTRLLDAHQFHDATGDVPVLDVQVAVPVPGRAVRAAEDPLDPLVLRDVVVPPHRGIGVVAEDGDDGVGL